MRSWLAVVLVAALTGPLASQDSEQWEYGRLFVTHGVPMVWWTREGTRQIDSGVAVLRSQATPPRRSLIENLRGKSDTVATLDTRRARRPFRVLMFTLNELGAQGWEWIFMTPSPPYDDYYWFKRRLRQTPAAR